MMPEVTKETTGLVIVNTGKGKGKTTAALGVLLRAWGWEKKVVMFQFIKSSRNEWGEHRAAQQMGVEILRADQRGERQAIELWNLAKERIISGSHDIVILDELSYPLRYGWLSVEEVLDVLRHRPKGIHVVITGRDVPQECIDFADLVTEMREVKHPLRKGIKAQPGIEF
ncbi:MAG: cob(I)yrinic acid a,c-diamide adenosyltransferase [Dehalococcoidales bacterium]